MPHTDSIEIAGSHLGVVIWAPVQTRTIQEVVATTTVGTKLKVVVALLALIQPIEAVETVRRAKGSILTQRRDDVG